ncbi:MAG: Tripartite-type tricarboxylate transporter, receptor component TctC [Hyphomicrobiales bacterium]|nr:Tripartite-type tricarboxylate transporter, receptor component TctC [Hyphomicrobiales bacterium]
MRMAALLACWALGFTLSTPVAATAQETAAAFFKGKTVTIVAGSSAGGGVDVYARLIGRHLGKHIPGNPTVIIQNMPGAGSLTAARHLYTVVPKDGTQIGVVLSTALFDPLMTGQDLQAYDPRKFLYLGNANADTSVCVVRRDAPVSSYAELSEKELVVGGTGPGSALVDYPVMERHLLGSKLRLIAGYKGSNEVSLAIQRNEVQGVCGLLWSSARQQYPDVLKPDGSVKVLVQEDTRPLPEIAKLGAPLIMEFAKTPEQKSALDVFLTQGSISRPFMLPPGVPADRAEALRRAFDATLEDPELRAEAAKQGSDVNAVSGAEVQALVEKVYATPRDLIAKLRSAAAVK